jgi:hypothetical protein
MPNVEISQLIAALRNVTATDLFEIQDPLDLTQGPSGTSKYVTGAELLGIVPPPVVINAILPMSYNGMTGALSVSLSATAPINYNVGSFTFSHNTTNLKITLNELNTIQDISTSSTPTFVNVAFSSISASPGDRIPIFNSDKTITSNTNFRYSNQYNNLLAGTTNFVGTSVDSGAICGQSHEVYADKAVCLGGAGNKIDLPAEGSTICGGFSCEASGPYSFIAASENSDSFTGICQSLVSSSSCSITGADYSSMIGSVSCTISGSNNSVVLGSLFSQNNSAKGAVIGSSSSTTSTGDSQFILGSDQCSIASGCDQSSIISSVLSAISSSCDGSVILGGTGNQIGTGSNYSSILFGSSNSVTGSRSAAGGRRAKSLNNGTFMIQCDNTASSDFTSTLDGTFCVKTLNGIGLGTAAPNSSVSLSGTFSTQRLTTAVSAATSTLKSNIIACTASNIVITLSTADLVVGRTYIIKDESGTATATPILIIPTSPALIDGQTSISISINYGCAHIYSNGTNWFTI